MKARVLKYSLTLSILSIILVGVVSAEANERRSKIIKGAVGTGPNRILGVPARDYGTILGVPLGVQGFMELGVFNPDGYQSLPLTRDTDRSAVLSTFVDPAFVEFFGIDPESIDPSLINVPLHKVKTLVRGDNITRESLPSILDSDPFSQSIAEPNEPITLGDWMSARGIALLQCFGQDNGRVRLIMKKLIPNRLYTVWGAFVSAELGPINQPLGGAPSAFVTDSRGNASFMRDLNFCPLDVVESATAQMAWIMVILHSDHMAYGAVAGPEGFGGQFPGTMLHVQMEFHLLGESVP